ncbi:pentatricopeptide repeat domain-containing protein [Colletotrichum graminicola M1.001]|uniref:Pentatricopeptide repeat domain-containing protein n=1 Tax=Colletotrichum graminicola (strain M1.001 / M2 / FGSC 10212) TaxID=645133 RepID=E3QE13_COLGM|nr:pentatricopeptide repeat domain-containing protein [Colletotrichum graminicola M1.001]EFQ29101.1 pentatricopeptide repeat domain-containing protein [Colletotrichum graminicola M1.001]
MNKASDATQDKLDEGIASHRETKSEITVEQESHNAPAQGIGKQPKVDAASPSKGRWTSKEEEAKGIDRAFETGANELHLTVLTEKRTITTTHDQRSAGDTQSSTPATTYTPTEGMQQPLRFRKIHNATPPKKHGSQREEVRSKNVNNTQKTTVGPIQYDSVLVAPAVQYHSRRETVTSMRRALDGVTRQLRLQAIQQVKDQPPINWRDTLDILRLRTRPIKGPWQIHARKILVEPELGNKLLYEVDHTIWDIHEQTRCHIELRWPKDDNGKRSNHGIYLLLSGDEEALEHAAEEISRIAIRNSCRISIEGAIGSQSIGSQASSAKPEKPASSTAEIVWKSSVEKQRPGYTAQYTLSVPYHKIPKPENWTPQTFLEYINAITNASLPDHLVSKFYGSGTTANKAAIALLKAAFADQTASNAHSRRAFKRALYFIERHGHSHRNEARELFFDEKLKLTLPPVDTGTFNTLLIGNVKVKDLYNFDSVLKLMVQHGCLPNAETWSLFLQLVENEQVRRHVIQIMYSLGLLLDPIAVQHTVKELVVYDTRHARDNWPGMREFLERLDANYGKYWVSQPAMNKIMIELGRLGDLTSCLELFDIMTAMSLTPTTYTLNIALYHARSQRNLTAAIGFLRKAFPLKIAFDEQTYNELFTLAFRTRRPNAIGLIWHHACVEGKTSWHMRNHVSRAIKQSQKGFKIKTADKLEVANFLALPSFCPQDMKLGGSYHAGARIADLMHQRFKEWRPDEPLHEALAATWVDDSRILWAVKQVKEQGKVLHETTEPGRPISLRPRLRTRSTDPPQCPRLDIIIKYVAPVDSDKSAFPDERTPETTAPDLEKNINP